MNNKTQYTYTFIILLTLFFSFLFKLDISNGGSARDIYFHWNYILALKNGLGIFMQKDLFTDLGMEIPHHYPLHHLIISRFSFLSNDLDSYLNFYFIFCLFLPILFYFCLDNRFPEVEVDRKIFISSIIYFLPNYQASAIWGNTHITSLSFFLGSLYFLINLEKLKDKNINLNIFLAVFFLACAAYTRQYYVIFFPYLFISIIRLTKLKNIIFFCLTSSVLSIPGLFLLYKHPILFFGQGGNSTDFKSSILIVLSIIFIYLTPFFISDFKSKLSEINQLLKNKKTLFILFFLSIIFFYLLLDFNYNGYIGGGLYFKISNVIIGNNIFFFIISFFSLLLCFYYFKERIEDIFLIIIISTTFSSGWPIFLKYFEPWLIFCMFLLIYKDFAKKLFKFNPHIVFFYFLTYWVGYFLYSEQFFKKINLLLPPIGQIF
jgi:hypothetical protein|tara:strand:+ start:18 stop:1313 length:1296 start_codon:yes stop_codon:yes gene_type:complete